MIKFNTLIKFALISSFVMISSCQSPSAAITSFGVDNNSIQLGKNDQSGVFINSSDKVFTAQDTIVLKVKAVGLTIKDSKIKTNIDLFLKKDKDILGTQTDILGADGFTQNVSGVEPSYTGTSGQADLTLTITPPSNTKGEIVANITLKDLNAQGKLSTFETKFTLK